MEAYVDARVHTSRRALFGSATRERVLLLLSLVESIHLREAARRLNASVNAMQKAIGTLEEVGVVGSRLVGSTRVVALNRRWIAAAELRKLLVRMAEADPMIVAAAEQLRRRPRRTGKRL